MTDYISDLDIMRFGFRSPEKRGFEFKDIQLKYCLALIQKCKWNKNKGEKEYAEIQSKANT